MSLNNLPVILVSASDNTVATKIISELIDNELEEKMYKEAGWRVWGLENKYYTAAVRLQPLPDACCEPCPPAEAHVIYLTENEDVGVAEARSSSAASRLRRGAVRLALVDAAESADAMVLWGLRARYEVVPLREAGGGAGAGAEAGVGRARAALHAHVWPGLRRRGAARARAPPSLIDDEESSDGEGEDGEDGGDEEESAVERAEAFADALGVLAALGERRGELRGELHDELRRERAEQLVAAFCRALGHDLRDQLA